MPLLMHKCTSILKSEIMAFHRSVVQHTLIQVWPLREEITAASMPKRSSNKNSSSDDGRAQYTKGPFAEGVWHSKIPPLLGLPSY